MSDLLSIGSASVRAYQSALNVVGVNIANAGTRGYVRRDPRLIEQAAGAGQQILYTNSQAGNGSLFSGVARQWDGFRAEAVRSGSAESGRTGATVTWLQRIEQSLSGAGLSTSLARFFNAGEGVAADPTGTAPRIGMIDAAGGVAAAFTSTATSLAAIRSDLEATGALETQKLNGVLAGLAEANSGLAKVRAGSSEQAQLLDQRDRLIDEASALVSVSLETDDRGVATLRLNDPNGPVLIAGQSVRQLAIAFNASGAVAFTVDPYGNAQAVAPRGGSLAGLAEASARLADMRAQLITTAQGFADAINQVQGGGRDLDGQPGAPLFDASAGDGSLVLAPVGPRQIAAARPWTSLGAPGNTGAATVRAATAGGGSPLGETRITFGAGVVTATDPVTGAVVGTEPYTAGSPVTIAGLTLTVSGTPASGDSFTIAATGSGSRDNGNLQTLSSLRGSARFESVTDDMVAQNASALAGTRQVAEAQQVILDGAYAARDTQSGVNLDQEAVELMRFQQAYQASSRIIQVARDTFDSLLGAVR